MQPFKGRSCGLVWAEFLWKMEHKGGALVRKKHNIQRLKYKYHRLLENLKNAAWFSTFYNKNCHEVCMPPHGDMNNFSQSLIFLC